ncbi:hypothetical protein D3C85_1412580 [compost metagenome]
MIRFFSALPTNGKKNTRSCHFIFCHIAAVHPLWLQPHIFTQVTVVIILVLAIILLILRSQLAGVLIRYFIVQIAIVRFRKGLIMFVGKDDIFILFREVIFGFHL